MKEDEKLIILQDILDTIINNIKKMVIMKDILNITELLQKYIEDNKITDMDKQFEIFDKIPVKQ
jgi:hypothetical protein